jgi:hypothetical protein
VELQDIKAGEEVYNKKNGKKYCIQGLLTHSEPPHDLLVRYTDEYGQEWGRPIGLFLLKFSLEKPIIAPITLNGYSIVNEL